VVVLCKLAAAEWAVLIMHLYVEICVQWQATTVEIAEKMEKKLLQRMERHSKHPIAELAESKKSSAEAGDAKDKASGATATTTVSPGAAPGGTNGAAPLPGLLIPPMDSQPSSSTRGEAISGGSRDVSSTDTGSSFVSGRSRSKTMIPPVKQSPGFKQVRISASSAAEIVSVSAHSSASPFACC
jgi:hypothetical protein